MAFWSVSLFRGHAGRQADVFLVFSDRRFLWTSWTRTVMKKTSSSTYN